MSALLEVLDATVTFAARGVGTKPVQALRAVSLSIAPGESVGVVGESGSGKSTLARVLLCLQRPTSGAVRFEGIDPWQADRASTLAFRRAVQPVFQDPASSLDPRMKVLEVVAEPLRVHQLVPRSGVERAVHALLERVGLSSEHALRHPHELSGGQKQRVAIARALAVAPRLLIADEAVSALDCSVQAQILNLFRDLGEQLGVATLFVAHDLAAVDFLCDRIAVMHAGRIVEILPRGAFSTGTAHPYSRLLVASVPSVGKPLEPQPACASLETATSGCAFRLRCDRATSRCEREEPHLQPQGDHGAVACHHPLV